MRIISIDFYVENCYQFICPRVGWDAGGGKKFDRRFLV